MTLSATVKVAGQESSATGSMTPVVEPIPVCMVPATPFWVAASTANVCRDTRVSYVKGGMFARLTASMEPCSAMSRVGNATANVAERHVEVTQLCQLLPVPAVSGRVQTMPPATTVSWSLRATYVPALWGWWVLTANMTWMNVQGISAPVECSV